MPENAEQYEFNSLLADLAEVAPWLDSLGFDKNDRFRRYRACIERVIEAEKKGDLEKLQSSISDQAAREFFWSMVECDEFVRSLKSLMRYPDLDLRPQLTRALRGPVDLLGEDERSNDARNITFELIVAGRLAAANLKPSFGDGTDTSTTFAETTFVFECKRPLSAARIEQAISKARAQLTNSTGKVGIIALSVSRLLNPGDPFSVPVTSNGDEAYAWLKCALAQFIEETRRFWQKDRPGVHGLYAYAFIPMKIDGLYSPVRHDVFAPIKQHGIEHDLLVWLQQSINLASSTV